MQDFPEQDQGFFALLERRWRVMAATLAIVAGAGSAVALSLPYSYESTAKLLVTRSGQATGGVRILEDASDPVNPFTNPLFTQTELARVAPVFEGVIRRLALTDAEGRPLTVEALAQKAQVVPVDKTDLIQVSFRANDAETAQRVTAAICDEYIARLHRIRQEGVAGALKLVDEQLKTAKDRLDEAEARLLAAKQRMGTVSIDQEIATTLTEVSALTSEVRMREVQLAGARARAASLRGKLGMSTGQALRASSYTESPELRALREQLSALETAPVLTGGYAEQHPEVVAHRQRIARVRQALRAETRRIYGSDVATRPLDDLRLGLLRQQIEAESEIRSTEAGLVAARERLRSLQGGLTQLPADQIELARLTREVSAAGDLYQHLLKKREEARLHRAIATTEVQVAQPADQPMKPILPLGGLGLPIALLAGLAAAFGVGSVRDLRARRHDPQGLVATYPSLKVFAMVPLLNRRERHGGDLVALRGTSPQYVEALNTLALGVEEHLVAREPGGKVLALTSALPGEGKSVTLANLAICLANAGHRVLLVDADYHRPRVHALFGLTAPGLGLMDVLRGLAAPLDVTQDGGPIDIVTTGRPASNGASDAYRRTIKGAVAAWRERYDYVLLDLPPLVLTSEVVNVARSADGLLMLLNLQKVAPQDLIPRIRQLQALRVDVLGLASISRMVGDQNSGYYLVPGESQAS